MPHLAHEHETVGLGVVVHLVREGVVEDHGLARLQPSLLLMILEAARSAGAAENAARPWDHKRRQGREHVVAVVRMERAARAAPLPRDADEAVRDGHPALPQRAYRAAHRAPGRA